jgi:hypothetical protein
VLRPSRLAFPLQAPTKPAGNYKKPSVREWISGSLKRVFPAPAHRLIGAIGRDVLAAIFGRGNPLIPEGSRGLGPAMNLRPNTLWLRCTKIRGVRLVGQGSVVVFSHCSQGPFGPLRQRQRRSRDGAARTVIPDYWIIQFLIAVNTVFFDIDPHFFLARLKLPVSISIQPVE